MIALSLEQLRKQIADRYPVGEPTDRSRSVTGEPYVVIGSQRHGNPDVPGTVNEGCSFEHAFDEEMACMQAAECFEKYAEDRNGVLYWREGPELEWIDKGTPYARCKVYMRCLISAKAPLA